MFFRFGLFDASTKKEMENERKAEDYLKEVGKIKAEVEEIKKTVITKENWKEKEEGIINNYVALNKLFCAVCKSYNWNKDEIERRIS